MDYLYTDSTLIPEARITETLARLTAFSKKIAALTPGTYTMPEAGLAAAREGMHVERTIRIKEEMGTPRHVVLVGIGGSSVGTEAVFEALKTPDSPELSVLDIVDASKVAAVLHRLKGVASEDLAVVVISKSGTTTETIANAAVLLTALEREHGEALRERVVMVGDTETPLADFAKQAGYRFVSIPARVGGRFSIFTAVGLVPLALLGIDIRALQAGAEKRMSGEQEGSTAARAAVVQYLWAEADFHTHMLFVTQERLQGLARWYEQLLAESLGKEETRSGGQAPRMLAPHRMGTRELHSTAQLYLSGFPGTATTFLDAEDTGQTYPLSTEGVGGLLSMNAPREYARIPRAITEGVRQAYTAQSLPYAVVALGALTPESLGTFFVERMLEVIYLAELMDVDAFDQPHVELYKSKTRQILG